MLLAMDEDFTAPRFAARGKAYVYVLPCRDEDLLKVGFSRESMQRFRTLHRSFFECFDLERGLLIEVDREHAGLPETVAEWHRYGTHRGLYGP